MEMKFCKACRKPFFPDPAGTDKAFEHDPHACPSCNEEARNNSKNTTNIKYFGEPPHPTR